MVFFTVKPLSSEPAAPACDINDYSVLENPLNAALHSSAGFASTLRKAREGERKTFFSECRGRSLDGSVHSPRRMRASGGWRGEGQGLRLVP